VLGAILTPCPDKSAEIGSTPHRSQSADRRPAWAVMKRTTGQSRVELPREETRRRKKDLVRPLELLHLALERLPMLPAGDILWPDRAQ
jgi:hypothetical protein